VKVILVNSFMVEQANEQSGSRAKDYGSGG